MITKDDLLNSDFLKQFKDGKELDGFLKEVFVRGTEKILEAELDSHLGYCKNDPTGNNSGNSRNGYTKKQLKSDFGDSAVRIPRDRNSSFDPQILSKGSTRSQGIENLIISLYAKGMSNSDIEQQLHEVYDCKISSSTISRITEKVNEDVIEWQNRPLEELYTIVWMDAIVFKVRENSRVVNKAIYLAWIPL